MPIGFTEIWKMIAGVAFFLWAVRSMEDTLGQLTGRGFKLFLKRQTSGRIKAVLASTLITAVVQSSSLVNLVVQNMVSAGILPLRNALALVLGANLGTTVNSWLVVLLGFTVQTQDYVLPVLGIAGICMVAIRKENWYAFLFRFLFSLSLLLFALGYIKSGMEQLVLQVGLEGFAGYPLALFVLVGIVLTGLVQAGSVIIVLALTALHSGIVNFYDACAIVLGAEIGTTLKLFLASAGGSSLKKRIALGNFMFNIIGGAIFLGLLQPAARVIRDVLAPGNSMLAVACFQTVFNLFCIFLFLPFLKPVARLLSARFKSADIKGEFIGSTSATDRNAAAALEKETAHFAVHVLAYIQSMFGLNISSDVESMVQKDFRGRSAEDRYAFVKQLYGLMHGYSLQLRHSIVNAEEQSRIDGLISAARNWMYAAKNIHDSAADIAQLSNSSNEVKYAFFKELQNRIGVFYGEMNELLQEGSGKKNLSDLDAVFKSIPKGYTAALKSLYEENLSKQLSPSEITTLLNSNREIYTSFKSFFYGMIDYLLPNADVAYFDQLPGFIR